MRDARIPSPGEQVIHQQDNLLKFLLFLSTVCASFFIMQTCADWLDAVRAASQGMHATLAFLAKWSIIAAFALGNAFLMLGMGVLSHEAIHRVLFRNTFFNDLAGGLMASFSMVPFYSNRQYHLTHHRYAHQPGFDPEEQMHNHSFWFGMLFGAAIGLKQHYDMIAANLFSRSSDRRGRVGAVKDLCFIAFSSSVYFLLLPRLGISPWYTFVPSLIALSPLNALRGLPDHYGLPAVAREGRNREFVFEVNHAEELRRSGPRAEEAAWIVVTNPVLEWIWSDIMYHAVHHAHPYLAHHHLKRVFQATRNERPYRVGRGYIRTLLAIRHLKYYQSSRSQEAPASAA